MDFGALFTGMTQQAMASRKEEQEREHQTFNDLMQIGFHIMDSPNTPVSMKREAQEMVNQALMTHLYSGQFKANKNKLHKFVESYLGTDAASKSAGYQQAAAQLGVGSGNAKPTQLGGFQPPTPAGRTLPLPPQEAVDLRQELPSNYGTTTVGGQLQMQPGVLPPPPQEAILDTTFKPFRYQDYGIQPPASEGGWVDPADQARFEHELNTAMGVHYGEYAKSKDFERSEAEITAKIKSVKESKDIPEKYKGEIIAKLRSGVAVQGSTRDVVGRDTVTVDEAAYMLGYKPDVPQGTTHLRLTYDPREQGGKPTGFQLADAPSRFYLQQLMEDYKTARAVDLGVNPDTYKTADQWAKDRANIEQLARSPVRYNEREAVVQTPDGGLKTVVLGSSSKVAESFTQPSGTQTTPAPAVEGKTIPGAGRPLPSAEVNPITTDVVNYEIADKIKQAIAKATPENWGALTGRLEQLTLKAGLGQLVDEDVIGLQALLDQGLNKTLVNMGGKTLTATELLRYSLAFPQLKQHYGQAKVYASTGLDLAKLALRVRLQNVPLASLKGLPGYKQWAGYAELDPETMQPSTPQGPPPGSRIRNMVPDGKGGYKLEEPAKK